MRVCLIGRRLIRSPGDYFEGRVGERSLSPDARAFHDSALRLGRTTVVQTLTNSLKICIMRVSPTPWLVAGIAFVVVGISRGIHTSFGVFNVALLDTFGWSRGATAGIFSVVLAVDALLSPVVGTINLFSVDYLKHGEPRRSW
jgi:hypothetical protein